MLGRHLGLVHHVARRVGVEPAGPDAQDLISAGTFGLVLAVDSFDASRGLAFSTYAARRIRGAILDDLRRRDWMPRSVRANNCKLRSATGELQARLGRAARPREIADALGVDLKTYWHWRSDLEGGVMLSCEGPLAQGPGSSLAFREVLSDPEAAGPGEETERMELVRLVQRAVAGLPARERTVLELYYFEELKQRQIAERLRVTEARVSQPRAQALRRLRTRLAGCRQDFGRGS
ncbi:MAG: sigma-70 family RNA polymerase sigma factor [Gemmatimonadales bacterium]